MKSDLLLQYHGGGNEWGGYFAVSYTHLDVYKRQVKYSDMLSKDFKIVYCYFTEENRDVFIEQYMATIFFRKDVSYRVKHIELLFIKM